MQVNAIPTPGGEQSPPGFFHQIISPGRVRFAWPSLIIVVPAGTTRMKGKKSMIRFESDYQEGTHPKILEALEKNEN